jgi:hypothetical protein
MNKKYPTFFLTWFNKFSRVPYPGLKVGSNKGCFEPTFWGTCTMWKSTLGEYMSFKTFMLRTSVMVTNSTQCYIQVTAPI